MVSRYGRIDRASVALSLVAVIAVLVAGFPVPAAAEDGGGEESSIPAVDEEGAEATIAGVVWLDDGDGYFQPETDTVIGQVPLEVVDEEGVIVAEAVSTADGTFETGPVAPGRYRLRTTVPEGHQVAPMGDAGGDAVANVMALPETGDSIAESELFDLAGPATSSFGVAFLAPADEDEGGPLPPDTDGGDESTEPEPLDDPDESDDDPVDTETPEEPPAMSMFGGASGTEMGTFSSGDPTPFTSCDARGVLFQTPSGGPVTVYGINMVTGQFNQLGQITSTGINGVGYNVLDNYIYGWDIGGNTVIRVGGNLEVEALGVPAGHQGATRANIGDVDEDGYFWYFDTVSGSNIWHKVDLIPGSPTYMEVVASGDVTGVTGSGGADWAYVPGGGDYLYRVMNESGSSYLWAFNRSTGAWVNRGEVPEVGTSVVGAVYADGDGYFYAADNNAPGNIYRIDVHNVTAELSSVGQPSSGNDGARCAQAPVYADWGDAPESYGSLLVDDGPRHGLPGYDPDTNTAPLMLGATVDSELDGFAGAAADGDDEDGIDDEDGVGQPVMAYLDSDIDVAVTVTNDGDEVATLAAWIDLDGDGVFETSERQTAVVPASSGTDVYSLSFPPLDEHEDSYLRVRVFGGAVADPSPLGATASGEVEDHVVHAHDLQLVKSSEPADGETVEPGDTVTYTLTVTNSASTAVTGVELVDDLSGVLDDAEITDGPDVDPEVAGTAEIEDGNLVFSGDIAAAGSVTITYTVTVAGIGDLGDGVLANVAGLDGTNCPLPPVTDTEDPSYDPDCSTTHPVAAYTLEKSSDPTEGSTVAPGDEVVYTVRVENVGGAPLEDLEVVDQAGGVLDDASIVAGPTASSGSVELDGDDLVWTGDLDVGDFATFSYTVEVSTDLDDAELYNVVGGHGPSSCPLPPVTDPEDDDHNPDCDVAHAVEAVRYLKEISDPDDVEDIGPGTVITYRVTVENVGSTDLEGLEFTDDLSEVLDDAGYVIDSETADHGEVSFEDLSRIEWTGDLDAGETATITYQVTVDDPIEGDGVLANVVTGSGPGSNCLAASDDPDCSVEVLLPIVTAVKTVTSAPPAAPGGEITFQIVVSNTGAATATDVELVDDLSGVLDDAAYNDDADADIGDVDFDDEAETLTWTGTLPPDTTATITYSVTVNDAGDLGDAMLLNAVAGVPNCPAPAVADPDDPDYVEDCATATPVEAWSAVKTVHPSTSVSPGDVVSYTLTVSNLGATDLTDLEVVDDLAAVLDDATFNDDETADIGAVDYAPGDELLTWTGDLEAGDVATITYSVTVADEPEELGDWNLVNAVTGSPNCPAPAVTDPDDPDFEPDCVTITLAGSWSAAKTADPAGPVGPGDIVVYTVTVTNLGATELVGIEVTDDLSGVLDDAAFNDDEIADIGEVDFDGDTEILTWSGDLGIDGEAVITYSVTVGAAGALTDASLVNAITGSPNCPDEPVTDPDDPDFDADCVTLTTVAAWTAAKTGHPATAIPGDVVTYTIEIVNTGAVALTDLALTDTLTDVIDDAVYNDDAEVDTGDVGHDSGVLTWEGDLEPGGTATITYSVTVRSADEIDDWQLVNAVTGSDNCAEPAVTDPEDPDFAPECVTITHVEAWSAVKTAEPAGAVAPGDVVEFTLVVTNLGANPQEGRVVTDDLSGVLDDASFNDDETADVGDVTYDDGVLTWSGDLDVEGSATITYSVTVHDAGELDDGILVNAITGSPNCPDPAVVDPDDPEFDGDCVTSTPVAAWQATKTVSPEGPVAPGDTVTYTLTIGNIGGADLTDLEVSDDLGLLLEAAEIDGTPTADVGEVDVDGDVLTWSGDLAVGGSAVVSYPATVLPAADIESWSLVNAITGSPNCPIEPVTDPGDGDFVEGCATTTPIWMFTVEKTSDASDAGLVPGDTVTYTIVVENIGGVDLDGDLAPIVTDDLTEALGVASYNDDAEADSGEVDYDEPILTWTGDLPVEGLATITFSVTLQAPVDSYRLVNAVTTNGVQCGAPAITDPSDEDFDAACVVDDPIAGVHYEKSATPGAIPLEVGDQVTYQITVTNSGETDLEALSFEDDLADILDDASYNDDLDADVGDAEIVDGVLTWLGSLDVGESATVTYSVTVTSSDDADGMLRNRVVGAGPNSNCLDGSENLDCVTAVPATPVTVRKRVVTPTVPNLGDVVTYEVVIENDTETPATNVVVVDDLRGVLDDATWNGNASSGGVGSLTLADGRLTWTGTVPALGSVTLTYSVTVAGPVPSGDGELLNVVTGGVNCALPVTDPTHDLFVPECITHHLLPVYQATIAVVDGAQPDPGDVVTYEVTIRNPSPVAVRNGVVTNNLTRVLDDAVYNGDVVASAGEISYRHPRLVWNGRLEPGDEVTFRYTATTVLPDDFGDALLVSRITAPNCPGPGCDTRTPLPAVKYEKVVATPSDSHVDPGSVVTFAITVTNRGAVDLEGLRFTDDMTAVLTLASFMQDASASTGNIDFRAPVLTWSGDLAAGEMATVMYSVRTNEDISADAVLVNVVVGEGPGTNCLPDAGVAPCVASIPLGESPAGGGGRVPRATSPLPAPSPLPQTGLGFAGLLVIALGLLFAGRAILGISGMRQKPAGGPSTWMRRTLSVWPFRPERRRRTIDDVPDSGPPGRPPI